MNRWTSDSYRTHAAYVPTLGAAVFDLLTPRVGERILDIGCGEGSLTEKIAAAGATVVGVDASADMVAAARARGLDARLIDAERLAFAREFDAVFSNAALHWVRDHDAMLDGVHRALKPGGRFVAEFGGHGNIAAIQVAIRSVLAHRGWKTNVHRYYATPAEYTMRLEAHGFAVGQIDLIPRPTPLPTGMRGWLETFERATLDALTPDQRESFLQEVEDLLREEVCDSYGNWTAHYMRLRFLATAIP
ncbi:MAG TPA: methyltransferase domain-containing protein [Vicinamibacterales bacterium]|nr:methyltransferase domain-containing protein [Vicinamibacterales bacterium]